MRIGISTSVIQRGRTGIGQYLFALLNSALTRWTTDELVLFVLEEDKPLFDFVRGRAQVSLVSERHRPAVKNILWHQIALPRLARDMGLDVLHVPSYRRLLWRKPCALVATIHDLAPFRLSGKYDWKRMFYGKVVARKLARRQDEIIAVSQTTANDVAQFFGVLQERISVVHNGVDHQRFSVVENGGVPARSKYQLIKPFFLYIARLEHPGKNHVRLISAFNRFKSTSGSEWELVLGGNDWHGAQQIHDAIRKSPFAGHIRCLGFVPDADVADLYRAAGAFVYPSLFEGFGMPPIEAMACGCPVISSRRGSLGEVVGEAAIVVDPEDEASIAAALVEVSTNPIARARLADVGKKHSKIFDWHRTAIETLAVYDRAASGRKVAEHPLLQRA